MAQFPAFPLWTDAYLADTGHLTTLEHGAYMLLLMTMWRGGGMLPNDDRKLAKYAGVQSNQWTRIKPTIMEFMTVSDDGQFVTQGRLSDELQYVRDHAKKQSRNARSRWQKNTAPPEAVEQHPADPSNGTTTNPLAHNDMGDATASFWQCQTDAPTPTPNIVDTNVSTLSVPEGSGTEKPARKRIVYPDDFEAAWQAFPTTPNMSKAEALPEWKKLAPEDRAMVLPSIAGYHAFLKANPTHPAIHFCRYISKRRFEGFAEATAPAETEKTWLTRLGWARGKHQWPVHQWGPMPGQPGCRAPAGLLRPDDGDGWQEARAA
jgi:uncharacterized protein YdaU (DUF1376 family)